MMTEIEYKRIINPYIKREIKTCSYCDRLDPLILLDGKYLYVTIAIGSMVEGYLQICAKKHRTAITGLIEEEREEFEKLKEIVFLSYQEVYQTHGIAFEHGQAGSCLWDEDEYLCNMASWCHHMHTHCVPVSVNIHNRVKELFPHFYMVKDAEEMLKIRKNILKAEQYLYFQPEAGNGYMYNVEGKTVPRQFLRTCVAEELKMLDRADWAVYPGIHYFELTRQKLQPVLQRLYKEKGV